MFVDFQLSEIQFTEQFLPDRFLRGKRKGQINSVESYPIDVPFPLLPLPPNWTVAYGTYVLVVPKSEKKKSRENYN